MGGPGMAKMLQDVQRKMMEDADKMQQRLEAARLDGSSGGGAVKATVNGHGKVIEVLIKKDVVDPEDVEMLQDLIATAFHEAPGEGRSPADGRAAETDARQYTRPESRRPVLKRAVQFPFCTL